MKASRRSFFTGLGICTLFALAQVACAEPGRLKVLFLGHNSPHHNSNLYSPILKEALAPQHIEMDYATTVDALNTENLKRYDAVLLYANHPRITPDQFAALSEFVESGRGFVPVHCASACFGHSQDFVKLVGGRFKSHKSGVFKAAVVNPSHPAMKGFTEFETWDETYVHSDHNPEARTVLMERVEGEVREPWTWVRDQGKGRVFYTASGHDERTWKDVSFQKLLFNGIVWAVGDARRMEWERNLPAAANGEGKSGN
jgi:type 1 glutamine amidotransferase